MIRFGLIFWLSLLVPSAFGQTLAGDWQGTLHWDGDFRLLLHVESSGGSHWKAIIYSIDQGPDPIIVTDVKRTGPEVSFAVPSIGADFRGRLDSRAQIIAGEWHMAGPRPITFNRATKQTLWKSDSTPHNIKMVPVGTDLKLEVVDWGGTGRPVILLAGLGNNAHIFDKFALLLTGKYHVYGISRRGFGASGTPAATAQNYSADRLGDDVLIVMDKLAIVRPVLIGHSIAGEELSSIGSRFPAKVAGLIYLDAAYAYALYDQQTGDLTLDALTLRKQLDAILPGGSGEQGLVIKEMLASLPQFQRDLERQQAEMKVLPAAPIQTPSMGPVEAVLLGQQKYEKNIDVPILAIFASPHDFGPIAPGDETKRAMLVSDTRRTEAQMKAFQRIIPLAQVETIPNANHFVFLSNSKETLHYINDFLQTLR